MIFIDCGNGNPDEYDIKFIKNISVMLDEMRAKTEQEKENDHNKVKRR